MTAAGSPAPLSDAVRDRARALCDKADELYQSDQGEFGTLELHHLADALRAALSAAEAGDAAGPRTPEWCEACLRPKRPAHMVGHDISPAEGPMCECRPVAPASPAPSGAALADDLDHWAEYLTRGVGTSWRADLERLEYALRAASRALRRNRETLELLREARRHLWDNHSLREENEEGEWCRRADAVLAALDKEERA